MTRPHLIFQKVFRKILINILLQSILSLTYRWWWMILTIIVWFKIPRCVVPQLFIGVLLSYLRYICLLAYIGVQHILCCYGFVFVCLRPVCCRFLLIVYFWFPLSVFSNVFVFFLTIISYDGLQYYLILKTKNQVTRTPPKTWGELRCSGRVNSSCSTSDIRRVNLVTDPVISHEWGKDRDCLRQGLEF